LALALVPTVMSVEGFAQTHGCQTAEPVSVGAAVGRSSPELDVAHEIATESTGSVLVRGGPQFSARTDMSLAGPVRLRVEGSTARWNVERDKYDSQVTERSSMGTMTARQVGAAIGLRGGRAPVCWNVLVGGGLHSLTFRNATLRRPGVSITAGIDVPTGDHGLVQIDAQVNIINTNGRYPASGTQALAASLMAGWAYRF